MNPLKYLREIYFLFGIIFSFVAYNLSQQWHEGSSGILPPSQQFIGGTGVDIAADGGALGFAILAGVCFACCAYLSKKSN